MSYRDLRGDETIREGDEVWNRLHNQWFPAYPDSKYLGNRVDATGREWRRPAGQPEQPTSPANKYHRVIRPSMGESGAAPITVDVYDVLTAFAVTCPAIQHAVKKLLCPGMRGAKSARQDIGEAIGSLHRALELMGGDGDERD